MLIILIDIEKSDEMRCDFNSEIKLDRVKFHEHLLKYSENYD